MWQNCINDKVWEKLYNSYKRTHWKYLSPYSHGYPFDTEKPPPNSGEYYGIHEIDREKLDERKKLSFFEQFKLFYR